MAKSLLTKHYQPDVHDEGLIKRYGLSIAILVVSIAMLLFLTWAYYTGWQNQFGPGKPSETQRSQP